MPARVRRSSSRCKLYERCEHLRAEAQCLAECIAMARNLVEQRGQKGTTMAERVRQPTVGGGRSLAALICLALLAATTPGYADAQMCVGDCNGDGMVEINELVLAVNIALGAV